MSAAQTTSRGRASVLLLTCLAIGAGGGSLSAQEARQPVDRELLRTLRARLDAARKLEEQLVQTRMQLELGLDISGGLPAPGTAELDAVRFGGQEQLNTERARVDLLERRHADLRLRVQGSEWTGARDRSTAGRADEVVASEPDRPAPRDAGEPVTVAPGRGLDAPVGPDSGDPARRAVIVSGSRDASALGFALLRAGNGLRRDVLRARRDGDEALAGQLAADADKRFADARRCFESLRDEGFATSRELFGLACACERLGDLAAADGLYQEVMAGDVETAPDGSQSYGSWGRTAQTARTVMHWVDDNRGWKPRRDPEEIPLPVR